MTLTTRSPEGGGEIVLPRACLAPDKEMKLKNVLAEGYTVSDDGLVYTIKLKTGVKFRGRHRL